MELLVFARVDDKNAAVSASTKLAVETQNLKLWRHAQAEDIEIEPVPVRAISRDADKIALREVDGDDGQKIWVGLSAGDAAPGVADKAAQNRHGIGEFFPRALPPLRLRCVRIVARPRLGKSRLLAPLMMRLNPRRIADSAGMAAHAAFPPHKRKSVKRLDMFAFFAFALDLRNGGAAFACVAALLDGPNVIDREFR